MAAVIASRDASDRFVEDPDQFGEEFGLAPTELAMLLEMGDDLTSLTAGFVSKRCGTLRWNAHRTLELLGPEGEEFLEDFVEGNPQSDSFRKDAAAFGDFVITHTASRPVEKFADRIIAEMARFERCRSNSFWDATVQVGPDDTSGPDKPEAVVLVAGANVGTFALDMRLPFRKTVRPWYLLPHDRCHLLFFHTRRRAQLRTLRLRPAEAEIVRSMPAGQPVSIASLRDSAPEQTDVDHLLRTLSWEEAIEWE